MQKLTYDPEVRILSIKLREGKSVDSEIKENIILDYDKNGRIINIDVMDINLEDVIKKPTRAKTPKRRLIKAKL